jgi:hypothetical protein
MQFEASLEMAEVLPLDDAAARLAGRINADLERVGRVTLPGLNWDAFNPYSSADSLASTKVSSRHAGMRSSTGSDGQPALGYSVARRCTSNVAN